MKRIVPVVALVALLVPAAAQAKGVNIRISSAPNGTDAGEAWTTNVIVTMPGNGRFGGVSPALVIRKGSVRKEFPTARTGTKGVYETEVVFPSRGKWRYGVADGFGTLEHGAGRVHWFPRVTIATGQPKLAQPPRPVTGDIRFEMRGAADAPHGQLPPETYVAPASTDDDDEDGGDGELVVFPAFAFVLAAVWLRRRHNNKRAA